MYILLVSVEGSPSQTDSYLFPTSIHGLFLVREQGLGQEKWSSPVPFLKEMMVLLDQDPSPGVNHNHFLLEAPSVHRAILEVRVSVGIGIRPGIIQQWLSILERLSKGNEYWKEYLMSLC